MAAAGIAALLQEQALRRERVFRDRMHPLDCYNDEEMYQRYRFSRRGCIHLINLLEEDLEHRTKRMHALPASLQVFVGLKFFATGCIMSTSGQVHGLHPSSASRTIRRVTQALCHLKNDHIRFPQGLADVRETQVGFGRLAGFPHVVGAIDCTHVGLHGAPLGDAEHTFVNRKGGKSINVQLVCNASYRITNVVARWPGSTHDSRILQNSRLGHQLADGVLQGLLVGDGGYALQSWLMTPVKDPQTNVERRYNRAHCRTRVVIEQVNGQWKNKFRCLLGHGMQMAPERVCDVIMACAVLFNISKDLKEREEEVVELDQGPEQVNLEGLNPTGVAMRNEIMNQYFS